jgi:hypothetical protein
MMRMNSTSTDDVCRKPSGERLRNALDELARRQVEGDSHWPTATALCQLAGVSRNALYRYHHDLLHELHRLQRRRLSASHTSNRRDLDGLRSENDALRDHVAKLAALVDHYYTAWNETRLLLERRERELAELRRKARDKVMRIRN